MDKVVFHSLIAAGLSALLSLTLAPWLMGRSMRKRGRPAVSLFRRVAACFLMSFAFLIGHSFLIGFSFLIGLCLVAALLSLPLGLVLLVLAAGGTALLLWAILMRPRLPMWGWHLGVILLCNLLYLGAFTVGLDRLRTLGKQPYDGSNLNGIGKGLHMYSDEYGEFPNDLRRLVDAEILGGYALLPMNAVAPRESRSPTSRPYAGPCEFSYIFLPADAPEDLVFVWESPKYHDGEGAYVLYKSYSVQWVTPEKLDQDLQRTRAWLAGHQTQTKPSSMPASAGAKPN